MDDDENKRNEIAATLFSVLAGLALLLLAGWVSLSKGCTGRDADPINTASVTPSLPAGDTKENDPAPEKEEGASPAEVSTQEKADRYAANAASSDQKEMAAKFTDVEKDNGVLKTKLQQSDSRIASLESSLKELKGKLKSLETDLAASNKAKGALQTKLEAALRGKNELAGKIETMKSLTEKLNASNLEKSNLSTKLQAAVAATAAAEASNNAEKTALKKSQAELKLAKERIGNLEGKLENLGKEKLSLTKTVDQLKSKASAAAKTHSASGDQLKKLAAENASLKDQLAKLKVESNKLGESAMAAGALEAEVEKLKLAASKISEDASERIKALTDQQKSLNEEVKRLTRANTALSNSISKLKEDAGKTAMDKESMLTEIGKLKKLSESSMAASNTQLNRLKAEAKTLAEQKSKQKADFDKQMASTNEKVRNLTAQNQSLSEQVTKLKSETGKMSSASAAELQQLRSDNKALSAEVARLTSAATASATSNNQLKKLSSDNQRLSDEISRLKAAARKAAVAATQSAEVASLKANLAKARQQLANLQGKMTAAKYGDKIKPAVSVEGLDLPLLVNDPANLDPDLLPLFAELREIEDSRDARIEAYRKISENGSDPVMTVKFDPGSSKVGSNDRAALKSLMADDDAKFLVVGYASTDGNPTSNAKLSSQRASQVAQHILGESKNQDRIQAVYFGQTVRFSEAYKSPNRVVEVWRVEK